MSKLAPGDFLLDSFPNMTVKGPMTGEGGPLILDSELEPVWFYPVGTGVVSTDLEQETYQGKPVLLWSQGIVGATGALRSGQVVVVDQHYRKVATLEAQGPAGCTGTTCWIISLHDAVINGANIWVTVYRDVPNQSLVAYGGPPAGTVYDGGIQEYNLKTGALEYTWDALNPGGTPNVPLSQSEQPAPPPTAPAGTVWDAYHLNSVQVLPGNQMLVSIRNTWAAYLIDTATNRIVWTLGGKASSFTIPSSARFAWQHQVQLLPDHEVTLFDDDCCGLLAGGKLAPANGPSTGMVLKLNLAEHTASAVGLYSHAPSLAAAFLGSMSLLPNGNALVGWGSLPYFSEYSKAGAQLLDVVWPGKDLSYRALFTNAWVGTPYYPPSAAVRTAGGRATVYASWDGATEVSAWRVLAGSSANRLNVVAIEPKTGFETAIGLKRSYPAYKVIALDANGRAIGSSGVFPNKKAAPPLPGSY